MRLLIALLIVTMLVPQAAAANGTPETVVPDSKVDSRVRDAFLFAYPLYQIARTRADAIARTRKAGRNVVDEFGHRARLAGPDDRAVTTPNNDTLISSAWLDLATGPVALTMPSAPSRYHSVALMDVFTDNFAVLGTRAQQGRGGKFLIVGPSWDGTVPPESTLIRSPSNDVWALVRILVDGPADLAAAAAVQSQFVLRPFDPAKAPLATPEAISATPDPRTMLAAANALLARNPPSGSRLARARDLAPFGVEMDGRDRWETLAPAVRESWVRQFPTLMTELRDGFGAVGVMREGWSYPRPGMGRYGKDDFYRAAVALGGLAALPVDEAVYLTAMTDAAGAPLDGKRRYQVTIPGKLPLKGFWSLTMYELTPDGRLFFNANPIDRYAIGDRSPGLIRNIDGSITISLQHDRPVEERDLNWLPTPIGPFRMTFRAYLPEKPLQTGKFSLPGVSAVP